MLDLDHENSIEQEEIEGDGKIESDDEDGGVYLS
jgi:hypothetical protein